MSARTLYKSCRQVALLALLLAPIDALWAAGTPAGTVIRNSATANFKDANGNALPAVKSNEVTTTVAQVAGVDISPAGGTQTILANGSAVFSPQVTNTGNGPDTYPLITAGLPAGWTLVFYRDLNGDGILETSEQTTGNILTSVFLAADSTARILMVVTSPGSATDGQSVPVTVTATSQFNSAVKDVSTFTSIVSAAALKVVKLVTPNTPKPGDIVTYELRGDNSGTATAFNVVMTDLLPAAVTYVPGSIRFGTGTSVTYATAQALTDANDSDSADFGITAAGTLTVKWGDAPGGQTGSMFFRVTVNAGLTAGTSIGNTVTITFENPKGTPAPSITSTTGTITVAPRPIPDVTLPSVAGISEPGGTKPYTLTVTNGGNTNDVLNIATTSTGGFPDTIWVDANADGIPGNNGDYKITDTNGEGKLDTGTLSPGESKQLLIVVTVPPGTPDGKVDVTTVTVTSSTDPTISDTGTLTTTVHAPVVTIVKSVSPTGSQPPGQVLTYTAVIANGGQGVATEVVFSDQIPAHTTYVTNSVRVNGTTRTDAADGDNVLVSNNSIVVNLGTLGAGGTQTITFSVTIQ